MSSALNFYPSEDISRPSCAPVLSSRGAPIFGAKFCRHSPPQNLETNPPHPERYAVFCCEQEYVQVIMRNCPSVRIALESSVNVSAIDVV